MHIFVQLPRVDQFELDGPDRKTILLTQESGAIPRKPATLIAPMTVINRAIRKKQFYNNPIRQRIWETMLQRRKFQLPFEILLDEGNPATATDKCVREVLDLEWEICSAGADFCF